MRSHRNHLCLILGLIFGMAAARGDPSLPGDPFVDPIVRVPGDFWFSRNALSFYHEQYEGDHQFHLWAYPSALQEDLKIWAPRLAYRWKDRLWLDVGTQRSETDPFISPLTFRGARVDYDLDPYRIAASVGETSQNFIPRILVGQPEFSANHLALTRRLGDYGWARLSTSGWRPQSDELALFPSYSVPEASRVISFDAEPELPYALDNLQIRGGYGLELTEPTNSLPSDRRSYDWHVSWNQPRLRLNARQTSQGRSYGPAHFENFRRGQSNLNASAIVDILPTLQWWESYDRFVFAQPLESGSRRSSENDTFSHELTYQPTSDFTGVILFSQSNNRFNPLNTELNTDRKQVRLNWDVSDNLRLSLSHFDINTSGALLNSSSNRSDLRADWWWDSQNRLTTLVGRSKVVGPSVVSEGLDLGLGYEHVFADDKGRLSFDYRRSRFGFALSPYQTYQLGLSLDPDPRWRLRGDVSLFDTGPESRITGSLSVNYLLNEHQELGITFDQRPFLLYPNLPGLEPSTNSIGLQLRQSFGGPLQQRFARRLQPELRIQVMGLHPEDHDQVTPVEGAKLRVDDEVVATTGADGLAEAKVPAGDHRVSLDLSSVGPHFELVNDPSGEITLGKADRRSLQFRAVAYSGVRLITWNDFFGQGELPVGYIPVGLVPLRLDGEEMSTDKEGQLLVGKLSPGKHILTIETAHLPPGLEAIGESEFEIELEPGQETLLTVPLRGFAQISGQVELRGGLSLPPQGLAITANGREIGRSDPTGHFQLKAPAGTVEIAVLTPELGPRAFLPNGAVALQLETGQSFEQNLVVSKTAQLEFQLVLNGLPLALEAVPVTLEGEGFRYTDSQGRISFTKLRPGKYTVILEEASLPQGYRLIGPKHRSLELHPGQNLDLKIEMRNDA